MDHRIHLLGDWAEVRAPVATLDRAIEVADVSLALIRFAHGALASVVNRALRPRQETYLRLDAQRATVELPHLDGSTRDNGRFTLAPTAREEGNRLARARQSFPPDTGSIHTAQLAEFIHNLATGTRPLTSGADARRTLDVLTARHQSAFTGRPVARGSIRPGDPFYTALHGGGSPLRPPSPAPAEP